jgi:hypothetical protein
MLISTQHLGLCKALHPHTLALAFEQSLNVSVH